MSVAYGSPDALPYLCAVYRCAECGRNAEQRGRHAGEIPNGWEVRARDAHLEHLCPVCAHPPAPARQTS
jgi:hypothetical protein